MSKRRVLAFIAGISGAAFGAAAQQPAPVDPAAVRPAAQVAPAPSSAPPPADPFVRDPRVPKPSPPQSATVPVNLLTTLETWSMSQADFVALLDGPANQEATYSRIEELATAGKAKLIGLTAISTKSGQRAVVESIDEFRYATEFDSAARPGEIAFPTTWQTRNTGDTLELEPVLGPDGKTISVNLVPRTVRFGGFAEWRAEPTSEPVAHPRFHNEGVTTSLTVQSGRPVFLSTATPAPDRALPQPSADVRLLILGVSAQVAPPPSVKSTQTEGRIEVLLYNLDRAAARQVLMKNSDSAKSHAAVRELVSRGEAQVELVSAFVTKFGNRAVNEEITEVAYPQETNPPSYASDKTPAEARAPASVGSFETRNVGVTVECEPTIDGEGRFVEIHIVPQVVSFNGTLKAEGIAARYPAQPSFTTRKITTSVTSAVGIPVLLGVMNRPRNSGVTDHKDDGKTTLAYLRVTPVTP